MTDKLHESLSALMDDEADDLELRRILKAMAPSAGDDGMTDLHGKWHRYHVISASLKQEIHTSPSRNLLAGVRASLESEELPARHLSDRSINAGKSILQILGKGAIAASVAVAVLFTADLVMVADNDNGASPAAEVADSGTSQAQLPGLTGQLNPDTETRVAVQERLDAGEMSRLEQVVSEELEEALETPEVPAVFKPAENR